MFYHDFFDEADFISGHTDRYLDKTTVADWQVMVSVISPNPIFVTCFSPEL